MATVNLQAHGALPLITGSAALTVIKPSEQGVLDWLQQFLGLTDKVLRISKSICELIEMMNDRF